jgi:hypothetical protein
MDLSAHEPGTVTDCPECRALAYEPGWYKTLREERVVGNRSDHVAIPEAETEAEEPAVPGPTVAETPPWRKPTARTGSLA